MAVIIPDEILRSANLTEREATLEVACHLYDAQKIGKGLAARLAGLSRSAFEEELIKRGMPVIRYTAEMLQEDLQSLQQVSRSRNGGADAGRQ